MFFMYDGGKGETMKQIYILFFVLSTFASIAEARIDNYDAKGLKLYNKHCKACHGNAYKGAGMKTSLQWRKLFRDDAKKFIALHQNLPEGKEIASLTERKSKVKHLRKFLIQSGSDMGVVPSCDGNFCGR